VPTLMNGTADIHADSIPTNVPEIIRKLRAGDENTLARTITLVEQRAPERIPILKAAFPSCSENRTSEVKRV
jgi:hypothetical protein